jgi:hypothetical protein
VKYISLGRAGRLLAAGGDGEHGDEQAGESQGCPSGPELQRGVRRHLPLQVSQLIIIKAVSVIRDILVRIRIPGCVPLTNGSGSNSGSDSFLH